MYNTDLDTHRKHLAIVFETLRNNSLCANSKKCVFAKNHIEYLGHWVSAHGVEADQGKIKAMLQWPHPKSVKELRGFLGLTGYYQRFVKSYGTITAPLTNLLKKDSFSWSEEATKAFEELRLAMVTLPVLALPDFSLPFVIETDASGYGLGAVLSQKGRPIAFISQTLKP